MRRQILVLMLIAMLVLAGCGGASEALPMPGGVAGSAPMQSAPQAPEVMRDAGVEAGPVPAGGAPQPQIPASQRLVIRNAMITVQVEQVSAAEAQLRARAEQLGGYVVSVETYGSDAQLTSTIVFRVPAERFEAALVGVEGLAQKVLARTVNGEDVTEEFVDLQARLRNLEATRDRLLDLLARADEVEAALQVNQALSDVQGQIEQIQGRIKYLTQSAALATIRVELRPVPPPPVIYEQNGWEPLRVAVEALAGLVSFGQGLLNLAIVLLVWLPVWLPVLFGVRWGWRRVRHRRPVPPAA
ncbi:MAG: DUF4349 domain-containing protein [Oscillochloridaceae bacterium umkhey_bin13]